jgi:hypothetical protein
MGRFNVMRKFLVLSIAIISMIIIVKTDNYPSLHAVDISVGASTWYAWYKPNSGENIDPAFLYGPAMSVKFNDAFNLTFVYYYGKYEYDYGRTTKRHDSDLVLNYRLNDYLKAFIGVKYRRIEADSTAGSGSPVIIRNLKADSIGPGLGLNGVYPLFGNMYFISTGSLLFAVRNAEYDLGFGVKDDRYYHSYGYNVSMGLGYYIESISTVINLGGRYQCFMDRKDTSIDDKFYGMTLTATYSFNI